MVNPIPHRHRLLRSQDFDGYHYTLEYFVLTNYFQNAGDIPRLLRKEESGPSRFVDQNWKNTYLVEQLHIKPLRMYSPPPRRTSTPRTLRSLVWWTDQTISQLFRTNSHSQDKINEKVKPLQSAKISRALGLRRNL